MTFNLFILILNYSVLNHNILLIDKETVLIYAIIIYSVGNRIKVNGINLKEKQKKDGAALK